MKGNISLSKISAWAFTLAMLALGMISCNNSISETPSSSKPGSQQTVDNFLGEGVVVTLPSCQALPESTRSVITEKTYYQLSDVASYNLSFVLNGKEVKTVSGKPGETLKILLQVYGQYTLSVSGLNSSGDIIGSGKSSFSLSEGSGYLTVDVSVKPSFTVKEYDPIDFILSIDNGVNVNVSWETNPISTESVITGSDLNTILESLSIGTIKQKLYIDDQTDCYLYDTDTRFFSLKLSSGENYYITDIYKGTTDKVTCYLVYGQSTLASAWAKCEFYDFQVVAGEVVSLKFKLSDLSKQGQTFENFIKSNPALINEEHTMVVKSFGLPEGSYSRTDGSHSVIIAGSSLSYDGARYTVSGVQIWSDSDKLKEYAVSLLKDGKSYVSCIWLYANGGNPYIHLNTPKEYTGELPATMDFSIMGEKVKTLYKQ